MASTDPQPPEPEPNTTLEAQPQSSEAAAPTAAPIPGPRATAFLNLYQKTLSTTLRTISYDNFAACFPTIATNAPESLRGLHEAMIQRLEGFAQKDFQALMEERNVIANLNALEELIHDASRRKAQCVITSEEAPTPPHQLPASALLSAHLLPHLQSTQGQLNARLQTVQSMNSTLFRTIQEQRREIEGLIEGVEAVVRDLEGACENGLGERVIVG